MKRLFRSVIAGGVSLTTLAVFAFVVGPLTGPLFGWRPSASTGEVAVIQSAESLSEVEALIADHEARVPNLKPELARGIVWYDSTARAKTALSIVYLHGFTASRREMYPVWERVAHEMKANLYYARVKGHGLSDGESLADLKAQDFIDEGRVALAIGRKLGERVVVVGMSTGAVIATALAAEERSASDLQALVLVSPNHRPAAKGAQFLSGPLGPMWARWILGEYRSFPTVNEQHAKYWTPRYRSEAIAAMMDLVEYVGRIDLSVVKVPTLTMYTSQDLVVDVDLIRERHSEIGAANKRIVDLPEAHRHEFAGEAVAPEAVDTTVQTATDFLRSI